MFTYINGLKGTVYCSDAYNVSNPRIIIGLESKDVLAMDLDSFLATVTVPPPQRTASTLELTSEQINSFIIPPPPPVPPATDIEASHEDISVIIHLLLVLSVINVGIS